VRKFVKAGAPHPCVYRPFRPARPDHREENPVSVYLYRWGKFAFRRKWIVLPIWFALFLILGALGTSSKSR